MWITLHTLPFTMVLPVWCGFSACSCPFKSPSSFFRLPLWNTGTPHFLKMTAILQLVHCSFPVNCSLAISTRTAILVFPLPHAHSSRSFSLLWERILFQSYSLPTCLGTASTMPPVLMSFQHRRVSQTCSKKLANFGSGVKWIGLVSPEVGSCDTLSRLGSPPRANG